MRRKLSRFQSSHFRPLLDDGIDRLRIERPSRNGAPFPDPTKLASLADFRGTARTARRMADLRAGVDRSLLRIPEMMRHEF